MNQDDRAVPPLLVIVGETASGKSAMAMELARRLDGEIISADSWQVYKNFDIGTAKPVLTEQAKVPHHLLDVAEAKDGFSAVLFQRLANAAIDDIASRGKLPIMVGGTGLYIDSVIYNYSFLPASDPSMRQELNTLSLTELLKKAQQMGLETGGIDTRNKRRVIRLIENNGELPTRHKLRSKTLILGLKVPRDELKSRIERRVDAMLAAGLEAEVRQLANKYGWGVEPMKGIGYKEFQPYLHEEQSLEETRQKIIRNTIDLAKRQRTWFRRQIYKNNSIHWIADRCKIDDIVEFITTYLNNNFS